MLTPGNAIRDPRLGVWGGTCEGVGRWQYARRWRSAQLGTSRRRKATTSNATDATDQARLRTASANPSAGT